MLEGKWIFESILINIKKKTCSEIILSFFLSKKKNSDVANIQTTAVRQGDHFIVNGEKKWITVCFFFSFLFRFFFYLNKQTKTNSLVIMHITILLQSELVEKEEEVFVVCFFKFPLFFLFLLIIPSYFVWILGISLLLIDRHTPGITVRRMKLQGNWMAGMKIQFFFF